jgi:hypothetical protein
MSVRRSLRVLERTTKCRGCEGEAFLKIFVRANNKYPGGIRAWLDENQLLDSQQMVENNTTRVEVTNDGDLRVTVPNHKIAALEFRK